MLIITCSTDFVYYVPQYVSPTYRVDSFEGRQNGPATGFSQSSGLVGSALGAEVVVDPVDVVSDSIELVELEDVLVVKLAEVVGALTDTVVSWPLTVVAINAADGIEVVLVVP